MEYVFLYQEWLHRRLHDYLYSSKPTRLRGREVTLPPRDYGAALMQAYIGRSSLDWIAEQTGIPLQRLRQWRKEPEFLLVMDWSKSIFSAAFRDQLVLSDYSIAQYHSIAAEVSLLEDSLRVAVRVPLYHRFKKLGRSLISRSQNSISMPPYDLNLFRRLFVFFLALEHHWHSAASRRINEDFLPLARDVVWPQIDQESWVEPALRSAQEATPLAQLRLALDNRLSQTFRTLL
jgi:hypothetical protein